MARRYPAARQVAEVLIFPTQLGFRYSCRNQDGMIIYESPRHFRSRFDIRKEARRRWPAAKILFA